MAESYQVVVTEGAQRNLQQIVEYLIEKASHEVAEKVRNGIEEEMAKLSQHSHSKGLLKGISSKQAVYRRVLKWSYRIIFTIEEEQLLVLVVRIDHTSRNPALLQDLP